MAAMTLSDLASVLEAGAKKSRCWPYNVDRQQEADVYEAMAEEARRLEAQPTGGTQ